MLLDAPGLPAPRALTTITYSARGIKVGWDESRNKQKILNRLKHAIGRLEEQGDVNI
jgi:hypothetical protein